MGAAQLGPQWVLGDLAHGAFVLLPAQSLPRKGTSVAVAIGGDELQGSLGFGMVSMAPKFAGHCLCHPWQLCPALLSWHCSQIVENPQKSNNPSPVSFYR